MIKQHSTGSSGFALLHAAEQRSPDLTVHMHGCSIPTEWSVAWLTASGKQRWMQNGHADARCSKVLCSQFWQLRCQA